MERLKKKFKGYSDTLGMSEAIDLYNIAIRDTDLGEFDIFLQYLGINDVNNRELYEGDVIELQITEDMLDIHKNGFANSNIGKYCKEKGNITSIICEIVPDSMTLSTQYNLYLLEDEKILRLSDGDLLAECIRQEDSSFPQYLANKGAFYIGNIVENPELIQQRGEIWDVFKDNDKVYIQPDNRTEMFELADIFGEDNIVFEKPNELTYPSYSDFTANINEAYIEGFRNLLYEKENPDIVKPVHWRNTDRNLEKVEFKNFKYSKDYLDKVNVNKDNSDLEDDYDRE